MGGFYGSVQVRSQDRGKIQKAVEQVAIAQGIKCLLGPELQGWVGIYPENCGQNPSVGEEIARQLNCEVFHLLVHDDDVMAYWFWRGEELLDQYWSAPGYFDESQREEQEAMSGQPEVFHDLLKGVIEPLRDLLQDESCFAFEYERLEKFAGLFGITNAVTSYEYLKDGETDDIEKWDQFEELPADTIEQEKKAAKEKRKQLNTLKKQLKLSGLLLADVTKKNCMPRVCCLEQGFAVAWNDHENRDAKPVLELHANPWKTPQVIPLDLTPQVNDMVADATGNHLAAALGKRTIVGNASDWHIHQEIPESDWAIAVGISDNGRVLAHSSREEVVLTDLDTGTRVKVWSNEEARILAFHPSGRYLLIVPQGGPIKIADLGPQGKEDLQQLAMVTSQVNFQSDSITQLLSLSREELEQHLRAKMEAGVQQQIELLRKKGKSADFEKTIHQIQEGFEATLKKTVDRMMSLRPESLPTPPTVREMPMFVKFTNDGQWLCCGASKGFRVYSWEAILAADDGNMPQPQWQYDVEYIVNGMQDGCVYAIAQEIGGTGVLFGGLSGQLFRLDLESGEVQSLLTMPENASIIQLTMSHDGQTLGIVSLPNLHDSDQKSQDTRSFCSIWSYPQILASVTH